MSSAPALHLPNRRYWLAAGALALLVAGCSKGSGDGPAPSASAVPAGEHFGAPFAGAPRHTLAQVLAEPAQYAAAGPLQLDGAVRRACSRKGCWMELAAGSAPEQPGCRVTFKNYGFFVPTDSAGARALVEGEVQVRRVSATRVEHYEAEGARFPNKHPDGSADEVQFIATGVELWR